MKCGVILIDHIRILIIGLSSLSYYRVNIIICIGNQMISIAIWNK